MTTKDEVLIFMDLLDLDEELVDQKLKAVMERSSFDVKHLNIALNLLKYKHLINVREETDCENTEEYNFIPKLLSNLHEDNIEYVCKLTNLVLCLNRPSLTSKAEHLLQQILTDLFDTNGTIQDEKCATALLKLKVCSSILNAVISNSQKVSLMFLETPMEGLLDASDEKLRNYFITNTVPLLFEGVLDYNILDHVCSYLYKQTSERQFMSLKVLASLAEYFLPVAGKDGTLKYESDLIFQNKFWELVLYGMNSVDAANRKMSIYLAKRAIDSVIAQKYNVKVKSQLGVMIFDWEPISEKILKQQWENYFILLESLEEKQSNIVLPSLQLFDNISKVGREWFNAALKIGLKHDNMVIKQTCIFHSMNNLITCIQEAKMLLEALNDINLYHSNEAITTNVSKLTKLCQDEETFIRIFQTIPLVKWSPVPLYYVTFSLFEIKELQDFHIDSSVLVRMVSQVLKTPCNNVIIRKYIHIFVFIIFKTLCCEIDCTSLAFICSTLQSDTVKDNVAPFLIHRWISNITLTDSQNLINCVSKSYLAGNVIFPILKKTNKASEYQVEISKKLEKLQNVCQRQYCDKSEYLDELIFLTSFYEEIYNIDEMADLQGTMSKCLLQYFLCLLLEDTISYTNDINTCINNCQHLLTSNNNNLKDVVLKLSSVCLRIFKDSNCDLQRKVFSLNILKWLLNNELVKNSVSITIIEIIDATELLDTKNVSAKGNHGRLLNNAYEKSCEIIHDLIDRKLEETLANTTKILAFIDNVVECGGYGCLKWLLKIMNKILPLLEDETKYDIDKFINRMWKEIEELKSNNQYAPCMKEFVNIITHNVLLKKSVYNNSIIFYCKNIIEAGYVTVTPLWFLVEKLSEKLITSDTAQLVYVLQEILLFAPVIRSDQRILDNTIYNASYGNQIDCSHPEGFHEPKKQEHPIACMVQSLSVKTLLNIKDAAIFKSITLSLRKRIDEIFRNKQRYHENSSHHRSLLLSLQHMVFLLFLQPHSVELDETMDWCLRLLAKLPHQRTVRVYIEWYVSLVFYVKDIPLKAETLEKEIFQSIPQISKFVIMFLVLKQRILDARYTLEEYVFVMEHLLSHTMVQTFNVRLHAQFLALKLYKIANYQQQKYEYTLQLIASNFENNKEEKNYKSLVSDVFISQTDMISCLTPDNIYKLVPNYYDVFTRIDTTYLPKEEDCANYLNENAISSNVTNFWMSKNRQRSEIKIERSSLIKPNSNEENEISGVIQKKYIPWKNMTDVISCEKEKRETPGALIVVASLVDKLPNLGGMARTSEVFGVKTYVVDSLRHLQDKQFQGLSVSAERWVDIEEVRPANLKGYLLMMKSEGYTVVAAEQTSNSVMLQSFKFPKKTLLLLGHEKEGVPCDLLPLMDSCVEIPQRGFVRSLNVHVTAAIFTWQYYWQNVL